MTCIICKVTLMEETKGIEREVVDGYRCWTQESTGYHYCPQCGLVYKKERE